MSAYEPVEERKAADVCPGLSLTGIKPDYENMKIKKIHYLQEAFIKKSEELLF